MKPLRSYEDVKETAKARRETKDAMRQPMKKVNKKRKGERFPQENLREPERLEWIRKQPCIVCGLTTGGAIDMATNRYIRAVVEAAHMRSKGAAGDDSSALPVCAFHHRLGTYSQHRMGIKSWATYHLLDIPALIAAHRKAYSLFLADKVKQGSGSTT